MSAAILSPAGDLLIAESGEVFRTSEEPASDLALVGTIPLGSRVSVDVHPVTGRILVLGMTEEARGRYDRNNVYRTEPGGRFLYLYGPDLALEQTLALPWFPTEQGDVPAVGVAAAFAPGGDRVHLIVRTDPSSTDLEAWGVATVPLP